MGVNVEYGAAHGRTGSSQHWDRKDRTVPAIPLVTCSPTHLCINECVDVLGRPILSEPREEGRGAH